MLCFTTSVSFLASILGYFKFIIIPIVSAIKGNKIDASNIKKILNKSNLNLIKIIISPTNIQGSIIKRAVNTLDFTILYGFIPESMELHSQYDIDHNTYKYSGVAVYDGKLADTAAAQVLSGTAAAQAGE